MDNYNNCLFNTTIRVIQMKKPFYRSMTFWSAVLWGAVAFLEVYSAVDPNTAKLAQALTGVGVVYGLRRSQK